MSSMKGFPWTVGSLVILCAAAAHAASGTLKASAPTAAGDEVVTISYKGADGTTAPIECHTGKSGTGNEGDDIQPPSGGVTPEAALENKVQKLVNGINYGPANGGKVTATASGGGSITITPVAEGASVEQVTKTNNTKEASDRLAIIGGTSGNLVGFVMFGGGLQGTDDAGGPATVTVGTMRAATTVNTSDFDSTEQLVTAIVRNLVQSGVAASVDPVTRLTVLVTLDPVLDAELVYGNTDVALRQSASISMRD